MSAEERGLAIGELRRYLAELGIDEERLSDDEAVELVRDVLRRLVRAFVPVLEVMQGIARELNQTLNPILELIEEHVEPEDPTE